MNQTVVVELGSSRIKCGYAGESRPRRVLFSRGGIGRDGGEPWTVELDGLGDSTACKWTSPFRYSESPGSVDAIKSAYEWEKTLYPLLLHILTSILFVQRPMRHRMLVIVNDIFLPTNLRDALHKVALEYLSLGGLWIANGGPFESIHYLLEGMPPRSPNTGRAKAHTIVDIGTTESRVVVSVTGSSILESTHRVTISGYESFLSNVKELCNGAEHNWVTSLDDANKAVLAWSSSRHAETVSVQLEENKEPAQIRTETMFEAFHRTYLDFTSPSSLVFALLSCLLDCPVDYRRSALQNIVLIGGGSVALRGIGDGGITSHLQRAIRQACSGIEQEEEKKDDGPSAIASFRFRSLGKVANDAEIYYPDPLAADLAVWIGGSVMGALRQSQKYHKK